MVTADECTGCKACIASCPYDARFVHPEGYIDKCTFCIHRVREGNDPACVAVCPTHAMIFGDIDNPQSHLSKLLEIRNHKTLIPEAGTSPRVYYLLYDKKEPQSWYVKVSIFYSFAIIRTIIAISLLYEGVKNDTSHTSTQKL